MILKNFLRNALVLGAVMVPLNVTTTTTATALPDYCTAAANRFCMGQEDADTNPLVPGTPAFRACVADAKTHLAECMVPPGGDGGDICYINGTLVPC